MDRMSASLGGGTSSLLGPNQRLALGILVLILVDIIWVLSSELTAYIFNDEKFDKPFYSTYVKTSMFLIFLLGFVFWTPWNEYCSKYNTPHNYTLVGTSEEVEENQQNLNNPEIDASAGAGDQVDIDNNANEPILSQSSYIPINYVHDRGDTTGGSESESDSAQQKSVRFSKLAEVRQCSDDDAEESLFARMSYQASLQAEALAYRLANRLDPFQTAKLAITFCLLWFLANYTYQLAISNTEVGIVNILSSTSSLFTLILASFFPSIEQDKFSLSKFLAVLLSFSGVVLVSLSDLNIENRAIPFGAVFSLISAFFYASYLVFLRKKVDHEDKLNFPMFFGFVGLFNLLLLWPMFLALNFTGVEHFEWPNKRQWMFLIVNGVIGTVFSEVLWLWGCFLTSSLIATLAISLTIPLSMIVDILMKGVSYSRLFYIGAIPMLLSFFAVTLFSHYNYDPALELCKKISRMFRSSQRRHSLRVNVETATIESDEDDLIPDDIIEEETSDTGFENVDVSNSNHANNSVNHTTTKSILINSEKNRDGQLQLNENGNQNDVHS